MMDKLDIPIIRLEDEYIHLFKLLNGNRTACGRLYRIIGFNSKGVADVITIRRVVYNGSHVVVDCPDCKKLINK